MDHQKYEISSPTLRNNTCWTYGIFCIGLGGPPEFLRTPFPGSEIDHQGPGTRPPCHIRINQQSTNKHKQPVWLPDGDLVRPAGQPSSPEGTTSATWDFNTWYLSRPKIGDLGGPGSLGKPSVQGGGPCPSCPPLQRSPRAPGPPRPPISGRPKNHALKAKCMVRGRHGTPHRRPRRASRTTGAQTRAGARGEGAEWKVDVTDKS